MGAVNTVTGYLKNHPAIIVFLVLFVIFNLNGRSFGSIDTVATSLLPFAMVDQHTLYLDQFMDYLYPVWYPHLGFLYPAGSHYVSIYPIVIPVLLTPLYALAYILLKLLQIPVDMYDPMFRLAVMGMEKLCASLMAALSGALIYLALKKLVDGRIALAGALIFSLATSVWSISSQGLWQQGMSGLLLSAMIYLILSGDQKGTSRYGCIALGVLSALFCFNRSSDSLLLLPVFVYVLMLKDRRIACYIAAAIIVALPFLAYNMYFFGNPVGGFNRMSNMLSIYNIPAGVAGLIISPNRGLLVYSPVVLFAIPGFAGISRLADQRLRWFLYAAGLSIILTILLYGSFTDWHAGSCYGTRYMTCIMPFVAVFTGLFLQGFTGMKKTELKNVAVVLICLLVLYSVFIQFVGAFCYTNGGYSWDVDNIGHGDSVFWNINDLQIIRSIQAGVWNPLSFLERL